MTQDTRHRRFTQSSEEKSGGIRSDGSGTGPPDMVEGVTRGTKVRTVRGRVRGVLLGSIGDFLHVVW